MKNNLTMRNNASAEADSVESSTAATAAVPVNSADRAILALRRNAVTAPRITVNSTGVLLSAARRLAKLRP